MPDRTWPALDVSGILRLDGAGSADTPPLAATERIHIVLAAFDLVAVDERSPDLWRVFFRSEDDRDRATAALRFDFPTLGAEPIDVADEDWAARSQADLHALRVGRIVVAPPWDVPAPQGSAAAGDAPAATGESANSHDIVIVIQPSMGFGTGHHATTRLCLAALQEIDVAGRTVIDVGCGSGVLAIAANLLGGTDVIGVDDDPDAIQAARESLALNPAASVELQVGSLGSLSLVPSDLVFANLTGSLLCSAAADLQRLCAAGARLILSGLLSHEEEAVRAAYAALAVERRDEEDGWICLTLAAS
jgi:ribosomal protein L11 methyltransferase